jgi:hypothetical protein
LSAFVRVATFVSTITTSRCGSIVMMGAGAGGEAA